MKKIILVLLIFVTTDSWAHCLDVYYTTVSKKQTIEKNCFVSEELALGEKESFFPKMSPPLRRVKYWRGKYSKIISTEHIYLREMVNVCNGNIISKRMIEEKTSDQIDFSVYNPNLDPSINKSFLLVPMTNEEALTEMEVAKINCHKD